MKKIRKISLLIILLVCVLVISGCDSSEKTVKTSNTNSNVKTGKMVHKHCTRAATAGEGIDVSLNYELYYTDDLLNVLHSEEKVTSENSESLDTYEKAYKDIHANYKGLKYYDTDVVRDENSVTSIIHINYDKVNIAALIDIEGEEDNIFENGQAKVDKWISLSKKFGTKCTVVNDLEEQNSEA
ncbi:MAG: DUF1307 domain-containing protein [Bacilli bacterium]|nr:DUF1307 domain-containing protein [Bacilli bacterium]